MFQIAGSGNRLNIGMAPYIRATVGQLLDPYAAYLVYDTFTDTNGVHLHDHTTLEKKPVGSTWGDIGTGGALTITGNKVVTSGTLVEERTVIETNDADVTITLSCTRNTTGTDNNQFGIVFRASDSTHFCTWRYVVALGAMYFSYDTGAGEQYPNNYAYTWAAGATHTIKIVLSGTSLKGYVDTTLLMDIAADYNTALTKHGVHGYYHQNEVDTRDTFTVAP